MPITEEQLADKINDAMNIMSDDANVDIINARRHLADEIAEGVAQFVIGRQTQVTGVQSGGSTAVGTIQE